MVGLSTEGTLVRSQSQTCGVFMNKVLLCTREIRGRILSSMGVCNLASIKVVPCLYCLAIKLALWYLIR